MTDKDEFEKARMVIDIFEEQTLKKPFSRPNKRLRELVDARYMLMYLLRQHTGLTVEEIGELWRRDGYKGKHHASVVHGCKKMSDLLTYDKATISTYTLCSTAIRNQMPGLVINKKSEREDIIETKRLVQKLIHREIERSNQIELFIDSIHNLPYVYKNYVIKKVKKWLTPS